MHYTVDQLLQGDSEVARYYQVAKQKWDEFFETHCDLERRRILRLTRGGFP
jgi:hypothetical protein